MNEPSPPPHPSDASGEQTASPPPPLAPAQAWSPDIAPSTDLRSLDPAVINYWRVQSLIGSIILMALLTLAGGIVLFNHFSAWPIVGGAWGFFFLLRLWLLIWHPQRSYRAWSYRVDDQVLETRHGIWFKVITLLPLSRLQHVDLERGPIERSFGLASLLLYTAGTQNATIPIPGLNAAEAAKLRDQLVAAGGDDGV